MQPKSPKIAIIEDDESIRKMYYYKLESCGYRVALASNGIEGLEIIRSHKPDIVLVDIMMPEMSGDEMLLKLRETDEGANTRIIVLTNLSKSEAPHSLRLLNIDRYIIKAHTTPAQIAEIIAEVIGRPNRSLSQMPLA